MIWLLGGYMWLFVHRPFEVWPVLGVLQLERAYMLMMIVVWFATPRKAWLPNRMHAALAFFTLALTVGWLASPYMDKSVDLVENYFKVAVFYILVITTVRDEDGLRRLVQLYLLAVGLYMVHSLREYMAGRMQWRMGTSRMIGVDETFSDPNAFASSLLYALPLTLPLWADRPGTLTRLALLGFTGIACLCILLTGSRAGFIGLCVLAMLVGLVLVRRKVLFLVLGGAGGALVLTVLTFALPQDLSNRYLTLVDSSRGPKNAAESASGRMAGFLAGLAAWEKSPVVGHGPGSFASATGREGGAHNLYGQVLSELGVLGALALAGLLFCFWRNLAEARRLSRSRPDRLRVGLAFHVSRAIGMDVVLLFLLGWSGHNLYRYNWQWCAAFQVIALHCLRHQVRASGAGPLRLPSLLGPGPRPRPRPRLAAG
jgi:O-antigen ligase